MFFGNRNRGFRQVEFDLSIGSKEAPYRVVFLADRLDATYYAYFHYALLPLAEGHRLSFHALSAQSIGKWSAPSRLVDSIISQAAPQLVVLVRYSLPFGDELLEHFRQRRVASLYHIDDDLLSLPVSLGNEVLVSHGTAAVREAREQLLAMADFVLPSTLRLSEAIRSRVPGAKLLSPMPPPYLGTLVPTVGSGARDQGSATIGYMASKSHGADLALVLPTIKVTLDRQPGAKFEIFGTLPMPEELVRRYQTSRVRSHPPAPAYAGFLARLAQLSWAAGLAPLVSSTFNRCKSAIKFLEYTACGIPVIASSGEVYSIIEDRQTGLLADSEDAWRNAILELLEDRAFGKSLVGKARLHCENAFPHSAVATRVMEILAKV